MRASDCGPRTALPSDQSAAADHSNTNNDNNDNNNTDDNNNNDITNETPFCLHRVIYCSYRRHALVIHYTRSPLEDSRLFGPSPWKILAATYEENDF